MLTKKQFKSYLEEFEKLNQEVEKIESIMFKSKIKDDFTGTLFGIGYYQNLILKILEETMEDNTKELDSWIGYWIYDLEYGKRYKKGFVTDKNGKNIKLKTIDDLYNLLTKK